MVPPPTSFSSTNPNHNKVALVTGSSSGIGYETSLTLARNGFLTYDTMRNLNKGENMKLTAAKESLPDPRDEMRLVMNSLDSAMMNMRSRVNGISTV